MQVERDHTETALAELTTLLRRLAADQATPSSSVDATTERLRARASIAFEWARGNADDRRAALELLAVELLAAELLGPTGDGLASDIPAARRLVELVEEQLGVHRAVLARGLLRSPDLLSMPPLAGMIAQLSLLMTLGPIDEVSLWTSDSSGEAELLCIAGATSPHEAVAQYAAAQLGRGSELAGAGDLVATRIEFSEAGVAVLVGRADPMFDRQVRALLLEAAPMLAATLDREHLIARRDHMEQSLRRARDRRLTRLGLDVHDGPLQDLAALAQDVRLFDAQLRATLSGHARERVLIGRVQDIEAQLVAVDADLRRLAVSLQSPFLTHHDLGRALREIVAAFEVGSGIEPRLTITGDLTSVSDSQQLAVLTITREALGNVREHTDATEATVRVTVDGDGLRGRITDNGSGFDVESTLLRAARDGHLGLVGMQERVRMLDGRSRIDSCVGGPTTLTFELPRWTPPDRD